MYLQIGLLPRDNPEQVPLAYRLYRRTDQDSIQLAAGFKQTFCRSVQIDFVGVWSVDMSYPSCLCTHRAYCRDTVASVGLLRAKTLPFTTANTTIKVFRHAVSLDEVYFPTLSCEKGSHCRPPSIEPSSCRTSITATTRSPQQHY